MLVFQSLTNKKNTKTYNEALVIAGPTSGNLKLTPLAAEKVGVKAGDNLAVVVLEGKVYIGAGINGVPVNGEDGKQLTTKTGKKVVEPGSSYGSTLGAQENSVLLNASAQAGWDTLGGSENANRYFTLEEGVEGMVPTGNKDANDQDIMHTGTFFGLVFQKEVTKAPRKSSKAADDEDEDEDEIVVAVGGTQDLAPQDSQEVTTQEVEFEDEDESEDEEEV